MFAVKEAHFYNHVMVDNTTKLQYLTFFSELPKSLAVMMYDVKEPKPGNKPEWANYEKDNVDLAFKCLS